MSKRFRKIIGSILVIANLLSSNFALPVIASTINPEPTETVATVETEAEKKEEDKEKEKDSDVTESSEDKSASEEAVPTPTSAEESETKETKETTETTAESSEDTESTETIGREATATPTAASTTSPKTTETTATPTPATTAEPSSETAAASESSKAAEPSETSATETPAPTQASDPVSGTLTRKILDSSGNSYTVIASYGIETGIPFDAELEVKEITSGKDYNEYYNKTVEVMGDQDVGYVRIFDISIVKNGVEFEPKDGTTVNVKIQLDDTLTKDLSVVHIADDKTAEVVEPESIKTEEGTEIVFEAEGFSAYAIVEKNLEPINAEWTCAKSLDDIKTLGESGFYVTSEGNDRVNNYYLTGGVVTNVTNNSDRDGLEATKTRYTTVPDGIAKFYFESVNGSNSEYKIYLKQDNGPDQYVQMTAVSGNNDRKGLKLVTDPDQATVFTLTKKNNYNSFVVQSGPATWIRNDKSGQPGNGDVVAFKAGDKNEFPVKLMYRAGAITSDPYGLNNKYYGLMYYDTGVAGKGMSSTSSAAGTLDTLTMPVLTKTGDRDDKLFVPNDTDLTLWKFTWLSDDVYTLSSQIGGSTKYLNIGASGLEISDTPQNIQVIPGTGTNVNKISLVANNNVVTYSGEIDSGFVVNGNDASRFRWLNLVELSELTSDYVLTYAAKKVSVSDERLTDGTKVIIYTRVWNETQKKYEFYAVDHEGNLVRVYEEGDEIQWIGDRINTLLWDYTIYYTKGKPHTKENENGYYELYNEYSEKFISPHADSSEALADSKIGINMVGRSEGEYYSSIVAWDEPNYSYAGIRTDNGKIISYHIYDSVPGNESTDFYFATITDLTITEDLTEVETVDNNQYGIKMKMINFDNNNGNWKTAEQSVFLGNTSGGAVLTPQQGLLSKNLGPDGYPTNKNGQSLATLYDSARLKDANHLFIDSTYKSSGYFEYDSTQNFAHLDESTGDFTVYQELGTSDNKTGASMQHGLFFPYDTITPGVYSAQKNMYDVSQNQLGPNDPRKYENLYNIPDPDYNFGMELETSFVQTPDGKDNWDHDIIYEFVGDDDFWLYVDGKLVLDLGGIHSAIRGTINFATGEVYIQGGSSQNTTLYEIFKKNLEDQGKSADEVQTELDNTFRLNSNNQYVFKNYTTHTMKIFFMERGRGSSNLHMRFNQSSVKANTVILSKELLGIDETETFCASFPFQIYYSLLDGEQAQYTTLSNHDDNIQVHYKGTNKNVKYEDNYSVGGCNYEHVYFLESGESCEIKVPDGAILYYIVECGVDPNIYRSVTANQTALTGTTPKYMDPDHEGRLDFGIEPEKVDDRTSVEYVNEVDPSAIRTVSFKKILWNENGVGGTELHNDDARFDFRLLFGTEHDNDEDDLELANMYVYHVKDEDGNYCKWDPAARDFVKIADGANDYSSLTDAQKRSACFTTSMYGAISKIPAFYTVEIRQVLAGTKFKVEERYTEMPDGFSRIKYDVYEDDDKTTLLNELEPEKSVCFVNFDKDPLIEVHNVKGYAIRIYKEWADDKFMADREDTYFALYIGNELQTDSIYKLPFDESTLYWYFPKLNTGTTLDDYHIYEVKIKDPVCNDPEDEGRVTGYTKLTPVHQGETISLSGKLKGETDYSDILYTASYSSVDYSNIRVDTIKNDRAGLTIKKTDMQPTPCPLAGAKFELRDENSNLIDTFTSDDTGFVAKAFLRKNVPYTLTETKSPNRYHGLDDALTITLNNDGTVTTDATSNKVVVNNSDPNNPVLTIKNIRYDFSINKLDKNTHQAIKDVKFELHKMRTVGGVTVVDFYPIAGYENLLTDENGIIPRIDSTLPAGTYELREVETPVTHHSLNYYVMFTVTDTGDIRINSVHPEVELHATETTDAVSGELRLNYTLLIYNYPVSENFTITKEVRGNLGNKDEPFEVEVTFKTPTDQAYTGTVNMKVNGTDVTPNNVNGVVTFDIKHGDRVEFTGLDEYTKFYVEETYKDYRPTVYVDGVLQQGDPGKADGNITDNKLVKLVNTREGVIPTGVDLPFEMSAVILSAMTAVVIFNTCLKMRRREDEED